MIDLSKSLYECLNDFDGAKGETRVIREESLLNPFKKLAKKMIYGGYFKVRMDYVIFIHTVEFYYHEEVGSEDVKIEDKIVYHRNGRYLRKMPDGSYKTMEVPFFPLMSLHSHWSGFDITFESSVGNYRASALVRKYSIYDLNAKAFLKLDTARKKSWPIPESEKTKFVGVFSWQEKPYIDTRSSYLKYYLNGFSLNNMESDIEWIDFPQIGDNDVFVLEKGRQNAAAHDWAYSGKSIEEHITEVVKSDFFKQH